MSQQSFGQTLAPSGVLRVAINVGNAVLAQRVDGGQVKGISVDLATRLAAQLGLPLSLHVYDAAGKVVDALNAGEWDLAFLAIDPKRGEEIAFTPAYVVIEGAYMVRKTASYRNSAELDQPDVRIAVGVGSAYELFLSRTLRHAALEKCDNGSAAFTHFIDKRLEALAGVRQVVEKLATEHGEYRVLKDGFMRIHQALGIPKSRVAALPYLAAFIEEMQRTGEVGAALQRSGQSPALAAPLA